ncbi:MAG TPA: Flp pilus assembly protein CpaB [Micromonosporaceae bacterium]|jgi:Flp pilus assembly protein CpaB
MDLTELRGPAAAIRVGLERVAAYRRLVMAVLVGIAVLAGLHVLRPAAAPTVRIWAAAHDLTGGRPLVRGDLADTRVPRADVPVGTLHPGQRVLGRLLAAPMRRGEPLTDVRLLTPSLLTAAGAAGDVAVPLRVADGAATRALVHAGDLVDVIATPDDADDTADTGATGGGTAAASATVVVHGVRVLATPTDTAATDAAGDSTGLLILAATTRQAATLAASASAARLSAAVQQQP